MSPLRLKAANKFGAKAVVLDGIRFDSQAEAKRYVELKLLERAGEIEDLRWHPRYELIAASTTGTLRGAISKLRTVGYYEADFSFYNLRTSERKIEDVKGLDTALSRWKRKHVKAQYGIDVTIVRMK